MLFALLTLFSWKYVKTRLTAGILPDMLGSLSAPQLYLGLGARGKAIGKKGGRGREGE